MIDLSASPTLKELPPVQLYFGSDRSLMLCQHWRGPKDECQQTFEQLIILEAADLAGLSLAPVDDGSAWEVKAIWRRGWLVEHVVESSKRGSGVIKAQPAARLQPG